MIRKLVVLGVIVIAVFAVAGHAQAATCTLLTVNLRNGSSDALIGSQVSSLIRFLQESGHISSAVALTPGRMTFGPQTLAGLKSFQVSERLAPTGVANLATRFRIFLRSCGAGSSNVPVAASGWQAGSSRLVTWNRALVRAGQGELALKKIDTSGRYVIAAATSNDGSELIILPSLLPAGYYDLEVRFVLTFGGRNYALGYPALAARQVNVGAAVYSGGGDRGRESNADREARERAQVSFDTLSAPGTLGHNEQSALTLGGNNVGYYRITFTCGGNPPAAKDPSTGENYCSGFRVNKTSYVQADGSSTSFPFRVENVAVGSRDIPITVQAFRSDGTLIGEKTITITVVPYGGAGATLNSFEVSNQTLSSGRPQTFSYSFTDLSRLTLSFNCSFNVLTASPQGACETLTLTPNAGARSGETELIFNNPGSSPSTVTATLMGYNSGFNVVGIKTLAFTVTPTSASVPAVQMVSPSIDSPVTWAEGSIQFIRWSFADGGNYPVSISIVRCANGAVPCSTSGQSAYVFTPSTTGLSRSWTVGRYTDGKSMALSNGYYLVRICSTANTGNCSGGLINITGATSFSSATFNSLTVPATTNSGATIYASVNGTNISRYDFTFSCGNFNNFTGAYHPTSNETYCSGNRLADDAPLALNASSGIFPFKVLTSSNSPQSITVTARAYSTNNVLIGTKSATVTVAPTVSASVPSSTQYSAVGAVLQQLINMLLAR